MERWLSLPASGGRRSALRHMNPWTLVLCVYIAYNLPGLINVGNVKNLQQAWSLHTGDLSKKLTVVASAFSASAKTKIEAKGGTVEIIASKPAEPAQA